MPVILMLLLFERRWLFKKGDNYRLPSIDVVMATLYIIVVTELLFPLFSKHFTGDSLDVVFYVSGSFIFFHTINKTIKQSV